MSKQIVTVECPQAVTEDRVEKISSEIIEVMDVDDVLFLDRGMTIKVIELEEDK